VWSHKSGHGQEKIGMTPSPLCLARDGRPGWTHSGADQPGHKHILIGRMVKPIWQSRGHHDGCEIEVAPRASLCTCRRPPSRINLERTHASHSATMPSIQKNVAREVSRISSAGQLSSKSKQRTHLLLHQPFTASNTLDSTPCIDRILMPAFGNDLSFGAACEVGPARRLEVPHLWEGEEQTGIGDPKSVRCPLRRLSQVEQI